MAAARRASIAKDPPRSPASAAPPAEAPAPLAPGPSASAAPLPSAEAPAPLAPAPSASSAPVKAAASGATPRAAVNAALLGNLVQANELYAQLAAENSGDKAFGLAARLTAARAVRRP